MPSGDKNIKRGPGRPKGVKDKLPRDMKLRVIAVWDKLEKEKKSLYVEAKSDPKWFYVNFIKPMLPRDVQVDVEVGEDLAKMILQSRERIGDRR